MSKLQDLKKQGKLAGWWDFRTGSLRDLSGNGNDIVATGGVWRNTKLGKAINPDQSATNFTVPHDASLVPADFTIIALADFSARDIKAANPNIFCKRNAGGNYSQFYVNGSGGLAVNSGNGTSSNTTDVLSSRPKTVACKVISGQKPSFYKNGSFVGEGNAVYTPATAVTADLIIGQYLSGNANNLESPLNALVFANEALTDQEISEIHNELSTQRGQGDPKTENYKWLNSPINNEFKTDSYWTKGTGWTIANRKATSDGSQSANSDLEQDNLLVNGDLYTVEYKVSGRSAGTIKVVAGTTEGTARSADGVYSELITRAGNEKIILRADADFVGSVDYIKVHPGIYSPYQSESRKWLPTLADVTDGEISNTGFKRSTGTWKVSEDSNKNKWVENVVAGVAYQKSLEAYGTFVFEVDKAGQPFVGFMASVIGGESATGQTGSFWWGVSGRVAYRRSVSGVPSYVFYTVASYLTSGVAYKFAITKTTSGTMTWYIKGGVYTDWTLVSTAGGVGSNPVVGDTITSSKYMVLDLDSGDKFRLLNIHAGVLGIPQLTTLYPN